MAGALRWFWVIKREVSDGTEWLERTLSHREGVDPSIVARALNGAGLLASRRLAFDEAYTALTESMEIYQQLGDRHGEARQAYQLMATAWLRDDLEEAKRLAPEAERINREVGDTWMLAWTLAVWATMARGGRSGGGAGEDDREPQSLPGPFRSSRRGMVSSQTRRRGT